MSIINKLTIENFKGIGQPVEFDFGRITLFFGQNSAGKSTVLHALNYLHDVFNLHVINADSTSLGEGSIDLGGFAQFVHRHDLERTIRFGIDLDCSNRDFMESDAAALFRELFEARQTDELARRLFDLSEVTSQIDFCSVQICIAWSDFLNQPFVKQLDLIFNNEHFLTVQSSSDCRRIEIVKLIADHTLFKNLEGWEDQGIYPYFEDVVESKYLDSDGSALIGLEGAKDALPIFSKPLKLAEIWSGEDWESADRKAEFRGGLSALLLGPLELLAEELGKLRYLGPIREIPGRDFSPRKGEGYNWANGLAAWDALFRDQGSLLKNVNEWMHGEDADKRRLETGYTVRIAEYKQLELASRLMGLMQAGSVDENRAEIDALINELPIEKRFLLYDESRSVEVYPGDVGIGISQLLPVVVGALSPRVRMLSVEQPELHIHPKLQVALGDLLIYAAKKLGKTFVLETHSEHIVLRLLRRIRETSNKNLELEDYSLTPNDLNVVYVQCIDGETQLIPLRVNKDGDFDDDWPQGFFEERDGELFF